MKKMNMLLTITILTLTFSSIFAQAQFTSVKDGEWHVASTWSTDPGATALPDSNSSVIVNHLLSTVNGDVCRNLTINGAVYGGEYLHIYGDLLNNGELRDHPDHGSDYLTVTINGSIINYGIYITGTTNFEGNLDHHLRTYNGNTISFGTAFGRNTEAAFIIDSVASISGNLLLGGSKMILPGGYVTQDTLILSDGLIDGGVIECNNNVIFGMGVNSTIGFNGVFNEQQHTFVKDAILEGYINFNGSSVDSSDATTSFIGTVVNNGTIIIAPNNSGNEADIFIEGNFTNNGIVKSQSNGLTLNFIKNSNFKNNGKLQNKRISFKNSHTFTNNSDSIGVQEIRGLDSNTTVSIVGELISNNLIIAFQSYNKIDINMNGGKMILPPNGKLISFAMDNTILEANNSILANAFTTSFKTSVKASTIVDPKIRYLKTSNRTIVLGQVEILTDGFFSGNATLNCNILNNGNMNASSVTTTGDIINNGIWNSGQFLVGNIINTGIINLSVWEITGNITNEGSWESYDILLNGTENQLIYMPTDSTINSNSIRFDAMLDGTNYQWTRNGVDIAGENSNILEFINGLHPDNATYKCVVDGNNSRSITIQSLTDVEEGNEVLPTKYMLSQNYPNPFNPSTTIKYSLPVRQAVETGYLNAVRQVIPSVQLKIYDILGRKVATLVNENQSPGNYKIIFNADGLPSGIYFYKLATSSGFVQTKKMLLLR